MSYLRLVYDAVRVEVMLRGNGSVVAAVHPSTLRTQALGLESVRLASTTDTVSIYVSSIFLSLCLIADRGKLAPAFTAIARPLLLAVQLTVKECP